MMAEGYKRCVAYSCIFLALFVLTGAMVSSSLARAAEDTGSAGSTMQGCRPLSDEKTDRYIFIDYISMQATCIAQVNAIVDTSDKICAPDKFTDLQAQRVVVSYIDQRPARLQERFTKLALEALVSAWPCLH